MFVKVYMSYKCNLDILRKQDEVKVSHHIIILGKQVLLPGGLFMVNENPVNFTKFGIGYIALIIIQMSR